MKYLIIITLLFLVACDKPQHTNPDYELANDAIDSILNKSSQIKYILNNSTAQEGMKSYLIAVIDRFNFAMIYQTELNKLERGDEKNKLIRRYNQEVHTDPYDFLPLGEITSTQRALFLTH